MNTELHGIPITKLPTQTSHINIEYPPQLGLFQPLPPFDKKYELGNLFIKDGLDRRYIYLLGKHEVRELSYARYAVMVYLNVDLDRSEHIDHINNDKTDDRLENLQILSNIMNWRKAKSILTREKIVTLCPVCKTTFIRKRNYKTLSNNRSDYINCCSRSCSAKIQINSTPEITRNIALFQNMYLIREHGYVHAKTYADGDYIEILTRFSPSALDYDKTIPGIDYTAWAYLTDKQRTDAVKQMLDNGESYATISRHFNVCGSHIQNFCTKHNLISDRTAASIRNKRLKKAVKCVELKKLGYTYDAISKEIGITPSVVHDNIKWLAPELTRQKHRDIWVAKIQECLAAGINSPIGIAAKLNSNTTVIKGWLDRSFKDRNMVKPRKARVH